MSKKILSVVLALVFVLTTFAVSAFAVGASGYEEDAAAYTQTWALGEPVDNGNGTWTVDVSLTANYYVGAISFVVTNTAPTNAVLTSVTKGAALTYEANIQMNATTGLVAIIPEPLTDADLGADLTAGGVIAKLTYTLAGGASANLAIENAPKTATNPGGELIAVRLSDNNLTTGKMIYGQTVTSVGETRTLGGAAAAPELIAKAGTTGYVDAARSYVYGVSPGTDPLNYFEATNGGYIEMSNGTASATNGTGATLTLYKDSTKATVIATYTLVIFGDVNGDGNIAVIDTTAILAHIAGTAPISGAALFAADVNADGNIAVLDTTAILTHIAGTAPLDPNVWAA